MAEDKFYLNTNYMDAVINQVQSIAEEMESGKERYRHDVTSLTKDWTGKGKNEFDKKTAQLFRSLTDVSQSFYDIAEELLAASEAYMEYDMSLAKSADGKQNRY